MNAPAAHKYSVVAMGPDRLRDAVDIGMWAFVAPGSVEENLGGDHNIDWDRAYAIAAPDGRLAAFHFSFRLERFPVPGAFVAAAGLSDVTVHPEHRRRGLLNAMMTAHLQRCAERGEPLSVLNASEPAIYGRYGYGLASTRLRVTVPRGAALRDVAGADRVTVHIDHADKQRHAEVVMRVQRDAAQCGGLTRPGWVQWETPTAVGPLFRDRPAERDGAETLRIMIAERDGEPVGFALFRRKGDWTPAGPSGEVVADPLAYVDAAAAHAIWSRLVDMDLMATAHARYLSPDDPLFGLLVDVRAVVPTVSDGLWVRIVDLPRALAARQYAAPLDVVLDVTDARIPANAGRYRVRADAFAGGATVTSTTAEPDIRLDVRELGAVYLGGTSLMALARAGQVAARTPEALARAATAFSWPVAPAFNWDF